MWKHRKILDSKKCVFVAFWNSSPPPTDLGMYLRRNKKCGRHPPPPHGNDLHMVARSLLCWLFMKPVSFASVPSPPPTPPLLVMLCFPTGTPWKTLGECYLFISTYCQLRTTVGPSFYHYLHSLTLCLMNITWELGLPTSQHSRTKCSCIAVYLSSQFLVTTGTLLHFV